MCRGVNVNAKKLPAELFVVQFIPIRLLDEQHTKSRLCRSDSGYASIPIVY